jgi:hypothetical protein
LEEYFGVIRSSDFDMGNTGCIYLKFVPKKGNIMYRSVLLIILIAISASFASAQEEYSGIYPHLAVYNNGMECGIGTVVPWADRLWITTYAAHVLSGTTDRLFEISPDLLTIKERPELGGSTPTGRLIHKESNQLFIGSYAIDAKGKVREIPVSQMPGRITAIARHLTDPVNKIYYATMEEGLYEVDVHNLKVECHIRDGNLTNPRSADPFPNAISSKLPGYHGKGLYSGQGLLIYSNNGEDRNPAALTNPFTPSGALASWQGSGDWNLIRRNQFTEVTGPGDIYGNQSPATDPIWALGWDARSLILMLLEKGEWHSYRLPKASHSYDGAHGWNTEWPRIRDIGEKDLLMTMHGMFWNFPSSFSKKNSAGIVPRSTYLKVIGDFCRFKDRIAIGCDDTANREFLNNRKAKGHLAAPQSQSNLWFLEPEMLDQLGPVIGRGAVWLNDKVKAHQPSDPFLISGFQKRAVHLVADKKTTFTIEVDVEGNGEWKKWKELDVDGYHWHEFDPSLTATWVRLKSGDSLNTVTAWFHLGNDGIHDAKRNPKFSGLATVSSKSPVGGLLLAMDENKRTLEFAAKNRDGKIGRYILNASMKLEPQESDEAWSRLQKGAAIPSREGVLQVDEASVLYTDDHGKRFRLPRNPDFFTAGPLGLGRLCREVATERDLFNCHGTFFELPAENAGGFSRIRPVSTHNLQINDYCSYRGLLVLSGVNMTAVADNRHIIRSDDGKAALWVGAIDDLWALGKPVGVGCPWLKTETEAGKYSDPYLMTGYDKKTLELSSSLSTRITAEVDISGMGDWHAFKTFDLTAGKTLKYEFPVFFQAYWIRFKTDADTTATARLIYR